MEELLTAFGIDTKLIIVQILNFVVLMAVLTYFLYKPVLRILREREEKIEKSIRDAEAAARSRETAEEDRKAILETAHSEAQEINTRAKLRAEEASAAIAAEAQEKSERIVKQAAEKGAQAQAKARAESEAEIAQLAVLAAEKVLHERT